ncbi:14267_t:CDS:1, partial [Racocetra fulgida]
VIDFFQEIVNLPQKLMDSSQESVEILYDETHKRQNLVGINGLLPHINKTIVFSIGDTFPNWPIAKHYVF